MSRDICTTTDEAYALYAGSTLSRHPHLMELAQRIEPDTTRLIRWWSDTQIDEFARMTPDELASAGKYELLEQFLQSILRGERD